MIQSVLGFATEIIIADTGSTDETKSIARDLGVRVLDIPWTDDFAAARNRSLELATQPWILVLDADEELDRAAREPLREILSGPPQGISLVRNHYTANIGNLASSLPTGHPAVEMGAIGFYQTSDVRILPNDPRVRFEGVVHETAEEMLSRAGFPNLRTELLIHHYGPLVSGERQLEKAKQYVTLAQKKTSVREEDWRPFFQYAVELQNLSRHHEAVEAFRNALMRCNLYAPTWRQLALSQIEIGETAQALESLREAMNLNPADILSWHALGVCFLSLKHLEQATNCFQTILNADPANLAAQKILSAITTARTDP